LPRGAENARLYPMKSALRAPAAALLLMALWDPDATGMEIIAHRGAMMLAPENTLASQRLAYELGVDTVEVDVRISRDLVPVILHDHFLERTTNGTGLLASLTLQELKQLDAGSWFGPQFAGERIPTLAEMLEVAKQYNRNVILDIKGDGIAPMVVAIIQQSRIPLRQVTILSWWRSMIEGYASRLPGVKIMAPPLRAGTDATIRPGEITAADFADLHRQKVTAFFLLSSVSRPDIKRIHAAGFETSLIYASPTHAFVCQDLGMDSFWTDFPDATVTSTKRLSQQWTNWAEGAGLAPDQRRTWEDADGDGANNLMEYALGTNPLVREPPHVTGGQLSGVENPAVRTPGAASVEWKLDLRENWSQFLNVTAQTSDGTRWTSLPPSCCLAPTPTHLDFTFPIASDRRFFRLKFDLKP
jgi:glycerophosphoryl diester phosphodiesterase